MDAALWQPRPAFPYQPAIESAPIDFQGRVESSGRTVEHYSRRLHPLERAAIEASNSIRSPDPGA